jgi:hypothetical protein
MEKWEYKKLYVPQDYQIEEAGREGWELVTVISFLGDKTYFFKRKSNPTK